MLHSIRRGLIPALAMSLLLSPTTRADEAAAPTKAKPAAKPAHAKASKVAHIKLSGSMEEKAPSSDPLLGLN